MTTALTLDSVLRQHPDPIVAEADGEVLMMHIESGSYFGLNKVASFIWNQLAQPRRIGAVCAAIQAEFAVDEAKCLEDAWRFLEDMIRYGLVEVVQP